jgi:hypothetical protein
MADATPRHRTYFEGDDDGSVLLALAAAKLLPADLEIVQKAHRRKNPGKEGMIKDIAALVNPAGGAGLSAVAVRDIDEELPDQIGTWFTQTMNAELPKVNPPVQVVQLPSSGKVLYYHIQAPSVAHVGRVVIVPAGLPGGLAATAYEIAQYAIDDFILLLAHEKTVYASVSEFSGVPHDLALRKLADVVALMKSNGIPIKHTKRLMHLFRAVTGFRAAPATFAERLVTVAIAVLGVARVRDIFLPLIEGLEEASTLLAPAAPHP